MLFHAFHISPLLIRWALTLVQPVVTRTPGVRLNSSSPIADWRSRKGIRTEAVRTYESDSGGHRRAPDSAAQAATSDPNATANARTQNPNATSDAPDADTAQDAAASNSRSNLVSTDAHNKDAENKAQGKQPGAQESAGQTLGGNGGGQGTMSPAFQEGYIQRMVILLRALRDGKTCLRRPPLRRALVNLHSCGVRSRFRAPSPVATVADGTNSESELRRGLHARLGRTRHRSRLRQHSLRSACKCWTE